MSKPVTYRVMKNRRKRRAKLHYFREKYKKAKTEEEKNKILEKVKKLAPWLSEKEFLMEEVKK